MDRVFLVLAIIGGIVGIFFSVISVVTNVVQGTASWLQLPRDIQKRLLLVISVCVILVIPYGYTSLSSQFKPDLPSSTQVATSTSTASPLPSVSSPTATSTPPSFPNSTPTALSGRTILYNEDWSKGADNWTTGDGWNITDGMLENDGSTKSSGIILAPFQPPSTNYSVEARIQFLSSIDMNSKYGFGIIVRSSGAGDGYACYIIGPDYAYALITEVAPSYSRLTLNYGSQIPLKSYQYPPVNTNWHTYSVEVRGSQINFLIDNRLYPSATNGDYPSGTVVGLIDNDSIIHVSNFKVTTT